LGLSHADIGDYRIVSDIHSSASSVRHIYLQQTVDGLPVYNGFLQVNINADGRILSVNNAFVPNLRSSFNRATPAITA
jgi:extracellular elastinolytic metalloproteinase